MTGNLLGESVLPFVKKEVENRQKIFGVGIDGNETRSISQLNYINNRNAWIKLASGVNIKDKDRLPSGLPSAEGFLGKELAKKSILFNSMSSLSDQKYQFRSGVDTSAGFWNQNFYGLGGTHQGIVPSPGIQDISIESRNNGSIRTATINIKAYNRFQFEVIELLYLRLGFTVLLEWGWDKYLDEKGKVKNVESTLVENTFFKGKSVSQLNMIKKINQTQETYKGSYGGFFGRIKNFSWDFGNDGTYTIKIDLITLGDVIESLKVNIPPTANQKTQMGAASKEEIKKFGKPNESILLANRSNSKLSAFLYNTIGTTAFDSKDYFNLAAAVNYRDSSYKYQGKLGPNYQYYIRFGELISIIQKHIIPDIKPSDKQLFFEPSAIDTTLLNYSPNLVSFDPRICIFKYDDGAINQDGISDIYVPQYTKSLEPALTRVGGSKKTKDPFIAEENTQPAQPSSTTSDFIGPQQDPNNPENVTNANKSDIEKGDIVFLKLYNLYINYAFIFQILKKNTDKEGNLSIYKFFEAICDGINSSFANVTQITPQIKDDKIVTFVERKPPLAIIKNLKKIKGAFSSETVELEVYGFNVKTKSSNFLKNIKFNTKIGPKLANQISIGATASGTTVGEDATAFSKWNKGLEDRFAEKITVPDVEITNTTTKVNNDQNTTTPSDTETGNNALKVKYEGNDEYIIKATTSNNSTLLADAISFPIPIEIEYDGGSATRYYIEDSNATKSKSRYQRTVIWKFEINKDGVIVDNQAKEYIKVDGKVYPRVNYNSTTHIVRTVSDYPPNQWNRIYSKITENTRKKLLEAYGAPTPTTQDADSTEVPDELKTEILERSKQVANMNYSAYLAQMFGGTPSIDSNLVNTSGISIGTISKPNTHYFPNENSEFVDAGKGSYKLYLEKYFGKNFEETGNPSNQAGFIPVEFSLEMDGLDGWKIYNKINIQQSFLPPQYSSTLEFLITKVSHKVDSSGWVTNLATLSTSNIDSPPSIKFNPGPKVKAISGSSNTGKFPPGNLFTSNRSNKRNAAPLKSDTSIPCENGFLHKYPGMLVEADAALYSRLKMRNNSDNKKFRLHYAAMSHFKNLLTAYENAVSENGKTFLERYGKLRINSAYRSIEKTPSGPNAAAPGKSRHGLGIAVDLQQPASYPEVYEWFRTNAPNLGWMRIPLINNGQTNETWHWELQFTGPYAKLTETHIGISNIKKNGKNGKKQYTVSNKQATGVEKIKPSYILDKTIFEKQKSKQV
jgi:hypothetical protein